MIFLIAPDIVFGRFSDTGFGRNLPQNQPEPEPENHALVASFKDLFQKLHVNVSKLESACIYYQIVATCDVCEKLPFCPIWKFFTVSDKKNEKKSLFLKKNPFSGFLAVGC
jgi:hypothetical protein